MIGNVFLNILILMLCILIKYKLVKLVFFKHLLELLSFFPFLVTKMKNYGEKCSFSLFWGSSAKHWINFIVEPIVQEWIQNL